MTAPLDSNAPVPFGVTESTFDPIGLSSSLWDLISYSEPNSRSAVVADDKVGEYRPDSARAIDAKANISATWRAVDSGTTADRSIEFEVGSATPEAVDSVTITCNKGEFAQIAVQAHKHIGGSRTNHNDTERSIQLPTFPSFGATNFGISLGTDFPVAAIQSSTLTINVGHTDDQDKDGNFLCGTSHGVTMTVHIEAIDPTNWATDETFKTAGWIVTEKDGKPIQSNTAHQSRTITLVKYLGGPTPSSSGT